MDKCIEWLEYHFTEDEKKQISKDLAQNFLSKESSESRLKEVKSQIKSEIETCERLISKLSSNINMGYEYRNIDCEQVKDYESRKIKIYRLDNNKFVRDRNMTSDELQLEFKKKDSMKKATKAKPEEKAPTTDELLEEGKDDGKSEQPPEDYK